MNLFDIHQIGDPILRTPTKEVTDITGRTAMMALAMIDVMHQAGGVALAANQVGIRQRIVVHHVDGPNKVVINPVIVEMDETLEAGVEGCLSVAGYSWMIPRAPTALVAGLDITGEPFEVEVEGTAARMFQHEIDHLDGLLLIDRIEPPTAQARARLICCGIPLA